MAFEWKAPKDIFKGEGIYHLTFVVVNRAPILGSLVPMSEPNAEGYTVWVRATDLGKSVLAMINELEVRFPDIEIIWKTLMPEHLHAVIWAHEGFDGSIKMVARGFGQGCSKIARRYAAALSVDGAQLNCANDTNEAASPTRHDCYDCGNGAHTLFSPPFVRTLSHKGQLAAMVKYVKSNPDNAWMRRLHPDLYVIRRNQVHGGLTFDCMGKGRLLDYPDRQVIALSRSLTAEQIEGEVRKALWHAERGVVTYCAAMNAGEKAVTKAIREGGYPLVVMMLEGFPPEGSEAARFFHPGGVYHKMCGDGLLYLMAPHAGNYENRELIARTDAELKRKDEEKGYTYRPLPHESKRWRMIAGNVMLRMVSGQVCVDTA